MASIPRIATLFASLFAPALLLAQTPAITVPGSIQATGTASVSAAPDQAQLTIGVVTEGATAEAAASANASTTTAVLDAVRRVLGNSGSTPTRNYSISPRYSSDPRNPIDSHRIVGYTASNNIQVTTSDLSLVSKLIDAASGAGANDIGGVSFQLKNPQPVQQQALSLATKEALAHAAAIAAGLGAKLGAVISAQEEAGFARPLPVFAAAQRVATPIQSGEIEVTATVIVTVALQK
ncbi:MAG TPA: SIMPL domain-containing protein [Bryobacteraceae bacterium]|nr:SIMPL domain-containing protein [Bryobacteraceae bacterium]